MRRIRVPGFTAFASALALVIAAIPAGGLTTSPVAQGPGNTVPVAVAHPAPTLTLSTTSSLGTVSWNGLTQQFTGGQQCQIVPSSGSASLLELQGVVGPRQARAGFRNGDIGVFEPDAVGNPLNAAQCALVDDQSFAADETLVLKLGDDVADVFGGLFATRATVTLVRSSRSGEIDVELYNGAGKVAERTIPWQGGQPGSQIRTDPFTVENGVFTEIRLTADVGSFSLRGAEFSLASQADATLCAGGEDSFTNEDGVKVTLIGIADGSECAPFGIKLRRAPDAQVWFTKPLDVSPDAQFIFEVPWDPFPVDDITLSAVELPEAVIDFEVPAPMGPIDHDMGFCPDYLFDGKGVLVGLPDFEDPTYQAARDDLDEMDMEPDRPEPNPIPETVGTQFACVGDRKAEVIKAEDGYEVHITDLIYLIGDAKMSLK